MTIAFEILLELEKREDFRGKIHQLFGDTRDSRRLYPIINTKTSRKTTDEMLTEKQIWAEEFYKLRNKIIHGDVLLEKDFFYNNKGHFYFSVLFFRMCIRKKLMKIPICNFRSVLKYQIIDDNGEFKIETSFLPPNGLLKD